MKRAKHEVTILKTADLYEMQKLIESHLDKGFDIQGQLSISPRRFPLQIDENYCLIMIRITSES